MKKGKLLGLVVFTIVVAALAINFGFFSKTRYENIIINEDAWNEIISTRVSGAFEIKSLKFNDNELFKDNQNRYYYSMVEDDKSAYTPTIKYKSPKKINIAIKEYIKDELIEDNEPLKMLFYDKREYYVIDVYVTTLPLLSIKYDAFSVESNIMDKFKLFEYRNIYSKTWEEKLNNVRNGKEDTINNKVSADLTNNQNMQIVLFDNRKGISNRYIKSDGLFKFRGASSLFYPKKGYRINLRENNENKNMSLLGLRDDDDYLLYAAYNDIEKIRNVFSTKLWNECCSINNSYSLNNGSEYKYIELFINDNYEGLYAIGYPIDTKTISIENNEYMFKKYSWDESEAAILNDNYDMLGYELVSGSSDIAYDYLVNYYRKLLTLNKNNYKSIYNYVDIQNAVDLFLFYNLTQADDNAGSASIKNTYMTFKGDGKALYTPWDLDLTFGNTYNSDVEILTSNYTNTPAYNVILKISPVYKLLSLNDSNIKKLLYDRYIYLRQNEWSDINITKILAKYETDIYDSGAYQRDMERWPDGGYENPSLKLSKFKSYVIERLEYMDAYMERYN